MPGITNHPAHVVPPIEITPRTPLVDERVSIRLLGFAPHALVTIRAQTFDEVGNQYRSYDVPWSASGTPRPRGL